MNRRDFIKLTSAGALGCAATEESIMAAETSAAPALPTLQNQPLPNLGTHWKLFEQLSARCRPKLSFLNDEFKDAAAWTERGRAVLLGHLHCAPPPCAPNPEIVEEVDRGSYVRQRVMINTTPDIRIPVYVLVPKGLTKPAPAMVALHDHGGFYLWGKEKMVQVDPEHPQLAEFKAKLYSGRSVADELARRGFVVIAPDMLHWGERAMYFADDPERIQKRSSDVTQQDVTEFNARSWAHEELVSRTAITCGATFSGIIIWDDLRVTDYLLTRPEVDRERVGCVGLSLGAVRAIYLGALHKNVRASVAAGWMAEYQPMAKCHVRSGIGFTKLVPGLYNDLDWPDVAGLHLPDALMTINGTKDQLYPLDAAEHAVEKLRRIYAKAGLTDKYEGVFFDGPHEFNAAMQDRAFDWLSRSLRA